MLIVARENPLPQALSDSPAHTIIHVESNYINFQRLKKAWKKKTNKNKQKKHE